jgi:hypothetical protein
MLLVTACGGDDAARGPQEMVCDVDLTDIESTIRSGLPTYDYNPKADAAELVADADRIISGELTSVSRVDDGVNEQRTVFTTAAGERFEMFSHWADRSAADPLEDGVTLHDVVFVAVLHEWQGRLSLGVQGGGFGCAGSNEAARPFIETPPPDLAGLSVDGIVQAINP